MPLSTAAINQIAQTFLAAEAENAPIEPVMSKYPDITAQDGYKVQQVVVNSLSQQGHKIVGKKAGATSETAQKSLQVSEPLYGVLFDMHHCAYGQAVSTGNLIRPLLECEVAFKMKRTLSGPNVTAADVLAATESVIAAFEIIDFRTRDFAPGLGEALCYNVFARGFVIGNEPKSPDQVDLPNFKLTLNKNGEQVAAATGAAVLGNPVNSMVWLVNKMAEHGLSLEAGEIVISGAIAAPQPIAAGDTFEAVFEGLGTISVAFV
jgi:2-keto-4-pentenoate hydratase